MRRRCFMLVGLGHLRRSRRYGCASDKGSWLEKSPGVTEPGGDDARPPPTELETVGGGW